MAHLFGFQAYVGIVLELPAIGHPLKVFPTDGLSMVTTSPVRAMRRMGCAVLILTRNSIYVLEDAERIYGPLRASDPLVEAMFEEQAPAPTPASTAWARSTVREPLLDLLDLEEEATEKSATLPEM